MNTNCNVSKKSIKFSKVRCTCMGNCMNCILLKRIRNMNNGDCANIKVLMFSGPTLQKILIRLSGLLIFSKDGEMLAPMQ